MVREARIQERVEEALKIEYEPEVDILNVYLQDSDTPLHHSSEAESGVILNYSEDGRLSSIEILDASKRFPAGQLATHTVDELIDLRKASKLSGIAAVTLRTQAEKGKLWAFKLAGQWVTTRERLQQYVDKRKATPHKANS
jgi:uncharacterized protein YuzE